MNLLGQKTYLGSKVSFQLVLKMVSTVDFNHRALSSSIFVCELNMSHRHKKLASLFAQHRNRRARKNTKLTGQKLCVLIYILSNGFKITRHKRLCCQLDILCFLKQFIYNVEVNAGCEKRTTELCSSKINGTPADKQK